MYRVRRLTSPDTPVGVFSDKHANDHTHVIKTPQVGEHQTPDPHEAVFAARRLNSAANATRPYCVDQEILDNSALDDWAERESSSKTRCGRCGVILETGHPLPGDTDETYCDQCLEAEHRDRR